MIELTVNEIRRLINVLLIRPTRSIAYNSRCSHWRRRHQARAKRAHYARRLHHVGAPQLRLAAEHFRRLVPWVASGINA
jgi:hypothetical protein